MIKTNSPLVYVSLYNYIGGENQLCPLDPDIWLKGMMEDASDPPLFFPEVFEDYASLFLKQSFGFDRSNITHFNGRNVYLRLVKSLGI